MIKKNDVLKSDNGQNNIKVLLIDGENIFYRDVEHSLVYCRTLSELERDYVIPKSVWNPNKWGNYWYISSDQDLIEASWDNDEIDKSRRDFLGVFETRELAEQALAEIKRKIKE